MRLIACALIVALSFPAFAADNLPSDAPTVTQVTPVDAILPCPDSLTKEDKANIVKAYTFQKERADTLEKEIVPKALVIGLVIGAFVAGAAIGAGVAVVVTNPPKPN